MKTGMNQIGGVEISGHSLIISGFRAATNVFIILGLTSMVVSMITYLIALSHFDVSFAFPFTSIAYLIILFYGYYVLGENIGIARIAGTAFVLLGVFLIARS
jgi:drug/metabolite transporter (DMT)-like permease